MKFQDLTIENFGAIGEAKINLNDRGLTLIQGENLDDGSANSNGAGKSTIVEALSWVLYGKTAKGVTGDSVINRAAGKGCRVSVFVHDSGESFEIARHRKHKSGKNSLTVIKTDTTGSTDDLTKGTAKLTQAVVDQIMGCPYDVFVAAVYSGQEAMPSLPDMTDKHLKLLIEEAAGITLLERAHEKARSRYAAKKSILAELDRQIHDADLSVSNADQRVDDAKESQRRWSAERDARVIDLETEAKRYLKDAKVFSDELAKMKPKADLQEELDKVNKSLAGLNKEKLERNKIADKVRKIEGSAATLKTKAQIGGDNVARLGSRLEKVKEQIGVPCPTCKRPHDEESLSATIDTLAAEKREAAKDTKAIIADFRVASESVREARTELEDFERTMTDASHASTLSAQISQRLAHRETVSDKRDRAVQQAKSLTEKMKVEKSAQNPFETTVSKRQEELNARREDLKRIQEEREPASEALAVADAVVDVFSPAGVRAHILDTVTPYLNERTAHYLGALADGQIEAIWQTLTPTAKGELREKFSIDVTHSDGGSSFLALSGGEKRKVRLSCALALQDLVATRATKAIDLWIGDEIDDALDASGLERLMGVLEDRAKERGTVLVVSHSNLKDWFRDTVTVVKKDGVSQIEEDY